MALLDSLALWCGSESNLTTKGKRRRLPSHEGDEVAVELEIATRSLAPEALALAWMKSGPHDVRPDLLLAMFGQDARSIQKCHAYGVRYLRCAYPDQLREEVIDCASADGLAALYRAHVAERVSRAGARRKLVPSVERRARQLRMRAADYREIRNFARLMFALRFVEACHRFHSGRVNPYRSATLKDRNAPAPSFALPRAAARVMAANI